MKDVMGLIYTSKNETSLRELTASRAVAALPVAGRYRMIDFMLSNMVNSGIRNVGVIMQKNYHSLMDHLGSGKALVDGRDFLVTEKQVRDELGRAGLKQREGQAVAHGLRGTVEDHAQNGVRARCAEARSPSSARRTCP